LPTRLIDGDLNEPGAEFALSTEVFHVRECLQYRFLRGFFGIGVIV
jgi:hypothetical protein